MAYNFAISYVLHSNISSFKKDTSKTKTCLGCKKRKSLKYFYKNMLLRGNRTSKCKKCLDKQQSVIRKIKEKKRLLTKIM